MTQRFSLYPLPSIQNGTLRFESLPFKLGTESIKADGEETRQSSQPKLCVSLVDTVSSEDSQRSSRNSVQALLESRYCIRDTVS